MHERGPEGGNLGNPAREVANRVKLIHDVEHAAGHIHGQCRQVLPMLYRVIPAYQQPNQTDVLRANILTLLGLAANEMVEAMEHLAKVQQFLDYVPQPAQAIERQHSRPLSVPLPARRPTTKRLGDM